MYHVVAVTLVDGGVISQYLSQTCSVYIIHTLQCDIIVITISTGCKYLFVQLLTHTRIHTLEVSVFTYTLGMYRSVLVLVYGGPVCK